jgi:hypothetical protein
MENKNRIKKTLDIQWKIYNSINHELNVCI